jgi:biofilm PGA synthesis N-glycosyltransferase PgaC
MTIAEVSIYVFFISLGILFYTYIGYGILAMVIGSLKRPVFYDSQDAFNVPLTVIIPAYNEAGVLEEKIKNTLAGLVGFDHAQVILITDGSTDGSSTMTFSGASVLHLHEGERKGKSAAINKAVTFANGEIIIITDANAMLNPEAFKKLVARFKNKKTGAVSGEKRVMAKNAHEDSKQGSTGGEGFYWKYESWLKKYSARMYTLTGAAGELLAFRKELFKPIPEDAILDDMEISLNMIRQGKVIDYEPAAFAVEPPSRSIGDEFKRKTRISAGVFQTLLRHFFVFNPFRHSVFVFQFNSHRVSRWTMGIICIPLLYLANLFLITDLLPKPEAIFFKMIFILQSIFYLFVIIGFLLRNQKRIPAFFFLPFYFIMMNMAVVVGFFRFLGKKETVLWRKANR